MFSLRSWTEPTWSSPYRVTCDTCKVSEGFDNERERWTWIQAHECPRQLRVLYLDSKRAADARG